MRLKSKQHRTHTLLSLFVAGYCSMAFMNTSSMFGLAQDFLPNQLQFSCQFCRASYLASKLASSQLAQESSQICPAVHGACRSIYRTLISRWATYIVGFGQDTRPQSYKLVRLRSVEASSAMQCTNTWTKDNTINPNRKHEEMLSRLRKKKILSLN